MLDQLKMNTIKRIMLCVMTERGATKAKIVESTQLSTSTVSSCVNSLLKLKLLVIGGMEESSGGRPSAIYRMNGAFGHFIGLDLQPEGIYGAVVNCDGEVLKQFGHTFKKEEIPVNILTELLEEEISSYKPVLGIGVGMGIVAKLDTKEQIILSAPAYNWDHVHLKEIIERKFMIFTYIDHRVNGAAICEGMTGNGRGKQHYLYIGESSGKKAALILDSRLCRGIESRTGEIPEAETEAVIRPEVLQFLGVSQLFVCYRTPSFKDRIYECATGFLGEILFIPQTDYTYPLGMAVTTQREWFASIYFML